MAVEHGWVFVDLFFVQSGFVFAHCYLVHGQMRAGVTARIFTVARIARIWPLHVVLLLLTALLTSGLPGTTISNIVLSAAGMQIALADPANTLNGPAWSLSVEVLCYLIFMVAALGGARFFKIVAFSAICLGAMDLLVNGTWGALIGRGLLGFFAGCILQQNIERTRGIPSLILAALVSIPFLVTPQNETLILTTLVAWPAVLILALRIRALQAAWLVWLGDRSYAVYLCHIPIYYMASGILPFFGEVTETKVLVAIGLCWVSILAVSDVLYRKLERPAQSAILAWNRPLLRHGNGREAQQIDLSQK